MNFLSNPPVLGEPINSIPTRSSLSFEQHGVNASLESVDKGPRLTRLVLKLSSSGDLGRLSRALETVPFELGYGYRGHDGASWR